METQLMIQDQEDQKVKIRGTITRIFAQNQNGSSSWMAGKIHAEEGVVSFAGICSGNKGDLVELEGEWTEHERFGKQFSAEGFRPVIDECPEGMARYIANNPRIKHIGPAKGRKLVEHYGSDLAGKLADSSCHEEISEFLGVPSDSISILAEEFAKDKEKIELKAYLAGFGLTHNQVETLIDKFGSEAYSMLKDNPHKMIPVLQGWGFRRVDEVALKMGIPKDKPSRIQAGIVYVLKEHINDGNTWMGYYSAVEKANKLLAMDAMDSEFRIREQLDRMIEDGDLYFKGDGNVGKIISFHYLVEYERFVLSRLTKYADADCPHKDKLMESTKVEGFNDLNGEQKNALLNSTLYTISMITGGAGTGKTFTLKKIISAYEDAGLDIACCAPTGKAARRMKESTGYIADTIHSTLGWHPVFEECVYHQGNPVPVDLVIVDEVSMLDTEWAYNLFSAIDFSKTALILVGDHNQLPSVGPGSVLRDLIHQKLCPVTLLMQVVRQAGTLKENSSAILDGRLKNVQTDDWEVHSEFTDAATAQIYILNRLQEFIDAGEDIRNVQVISPQKNGEVGVKELNNVIQQLVHQNNIPEWDGKSRFTFYPKDKIIRLKNDKEVGVMNGNQGTLLRIDKDDKGNDKYIVQWDDNRILEHNTDWMKNCDLGYCLTIHKVQGSEYPYVIVVCHKSHQYMLHRNLLYTAVTRARKWVSIVGDMWGMRTAVQTTKPNQRQTFLSLLDRLSPADGVPAEGGK